MTYDRIVHDFDSHIRKSGCQYYNEFYIGITNDVDTRLFGQHRVNKDKQWWIFSPADNEEIARDVEKHYLEFGMKGGPGGGSGKGDSKIVYCYVITPYTVE